LRFRPSGVAGCILDGMRRARRGVDGRVSRIVPIDLRGRGLDTRYADGDAWSTRDADGSFSDAGRPLALVGRGRRRDNGCVDAQGAQPRIAYRTDRSPRARMWIRDMQPVTPGQRTTQMPASVRRIEPARSSSARASPRRLLLTRKVSRSWARDRGLAAVRSAASTRSGRDGA
jgi:hypothetical protein